MWNEISNTTQTWLIYWLNFWRLALVYVFGKLWFFLALGGFIPFLRAAIKHEAQGQVRLDDPYRTAQGMGAYHPYANLQDRAKRRN